MTHSTPTLTKQREINFDKQSESISVRATRTPTHQIEVVHNRNGWFINHGVSGLPARCYGPLEGPITIVEALTYVATQIALNQ